MTPIAVVIVNHNTCNHLRACLTSVQAERPGEIVVVDNASEDGSVAMVRADFSEATLYANATNLGYGAAANQAITCISSPYVLLLNSDTCLERGALSALGSYLDAHPRAAVVGPRLADPSGSLQRSCYPFPSPLSIFLEQTRLEGLVRYLPVIKEVYLRTWSHSRARIVPSVVGAALAIRREAFHAVGGFDESIFMYSEETDLCFRLIQAGWQVHFVPVTTITHVQGASTRQRRADMLVQIYASNLRFYQRVHAGLSLALILLILRASLSAKLVRDSVRLHLARDARARARWGEDVKVWRLILMQLRTAA